MFGNRQEEEEAMRKTRRGDSKEFTDVDAEKKFAFFLTQKTKRIVLLFSKTQHNRFQQILELLLTGGYFRARINGISPFDKILGGLAWAISACNVDVDIDVFQVCAALGEERT